MGIREYKILGNIKSRDRVTWNFLADKRVMLTYFRLLPNPNSEVYLKGFNRGPWAVV